MAARASLRTASSSLHSVSSRFLTDRASGPGGLFRSAQSIINPAQERQKQSNSRLRRARIELDDRILPQELRDSDRKPFESHEDIRDFVEARIQESMRTGQFDNLKNKGRPLPEQPATALEYAMRIMRQNGIRPHWLQLMHDIDAEKRHVRAALRHAWHHHMPHAPNRWALAVRLAELRIVHVNSHVDTFNLIRPSSVAHLFRLRLRIKEEIQRAKESDPPEDEKQESKPQPKEVKEEPRPSWQLFARFVRATDVKEYERPTWGRRRNDTCDPNQDKPK